MVSVRVNLLHARWYRSPSSSQQKSADTRSLNVTLSHGYEISSSGIPEPYIKVNWRFEETQILYHRFL